MIPIVLAVENLEGSDAAAAARARRVEMLAERVDDLVVLAEEGSVPEDAPARVDVVGRAGSYARSMRALQTERGPGVVVVDGGVLLLERVSAAARASQHRVLWSLDGAPAAATADRAGDLADGALVASSTWFPRLVGMRSWVVRPRGGATNDAGPDAPWPPDPSAWADRVVQAAQIVAAGTVSVRAAPAPISWRASATDAADASTAPVTVDHPSPHPPDPTAFDERRRGRMALLGMAVLVVVLGLVVAAGLSSSSDGESKRRDTGGVDSSPDDSSTPTTERPSTDADKPDGPRTGSNPDGRADDDRRPTSTTRAGSGGSGTASNRTVSAADPDADPGTSPATNPPAPTQPTTAPTAPPTTAPPPPTTTRPPPPTTTPPPPPTKPPAPTTTPPPPVSSIVPGRPGR